MKVLRNGIPCLVCILLLSGLLPAAGPATAQSAGPQSAGVLAGYTQRVSVDSYGLQGDGNTADRPALSADGRYVAFTSWATNLVPGDTNDAFDIFVRDRIRGMTTRVSVASDGSQADDSSLEPAISADGRYVAFRSDATNLVPGDLHNHRDIFVHDLETGLTVRVSVDSQGNQGNSSSYEPSLSADGRFVAFHSYASNLVPDDHNSEADIFIHDRDADEDGNLDEPGAIRTLRVSVASGGGQANRDSFSPSLSSDGRYVAFRSYATNLVPGDTNGKIDIFVHNCETVETTCVSVATDGSQGNDDSQGPTVSADGRYVAFESDAANLVPGDTNTHTDIFVHDRDTGETTRVSVASGGGQVEHGSSVEPSISADGRLVAFWSTAHGLVPGWENENVYVHDIQTIETYGISVRLDGEHSTDNNRKPAISGDGWTVAWHSDEEHFVPDDTNNAWDQFVREDDRLGPCPIHVSAAPASVPTDGATASTLTLECARPGHQVRFYGSRGVADPIAQSVGTVDASGQYSTTVTSLLPGWSYFRVEDLTWRRVLNAKAMVTFEGDGGPAKPPPGGYPVEITGVDFDVPLDGAYLQGISVPNLVQVHVDWRGNRPGRVDFMLNGTTYSEWANESGASHTFDMGLDLVPGPNLLHIIAFDSLGRWSLAEDRVPEGVPQPEWLPGLQALDGIGQGEFRGSWDGGGVYSFEVEFPPDGWALGAEDFLPFDTGAEVTASFGGGLSIPTTCDQPVKAWAAAGLEFECNLASVEIEGSVKATGTLQSMSVCRVMHPTGTLELVIAVSGEKSWPVLELVLSFIGGPAATLLEGAPDCVKNALGEIYLEARLGATFTTGATLIAESPYLEWGGITLTGGPGLEAGYKIEPVDGLGAKVWLGASGVATFSNPDPLRDVTNMHFDSLTLSGEAGAKVFWWGGEESKTAHVSWTYTPRGWQAVVGPVRATPWHLVGHPASPTYATFVAGPEAPQAFGPPEQRAPEWSAQSTVTSTLVSDVYTYTLPSLAVRPAAQDAVVAWTHDDTGKPVGQSLEIEYSRWNGSSWSAPAAVTDDNYPDMLPKLAWAGSNRAVAVWQRIPESLPISATWDITTAKTIEIGTASYDAGAGTWSPAALLTDNEALDYGAKLAGNSSGKLLATWKQNTDGIVGGGAAHPDSIVSAFYDVGWSAPAVAVANVPSLGDVAVGYGTNAATIAYTALITPTGEVTPTSQLFTAQWNGSWQPPLQRTSDGLKHHSPQVVYNASNQPLLIWVAGGELKLLNLTTGATAVLALADGAAIDQMSAVQDGSGSLAVLFTAQYAQRDLFLSVYDKAHNLWGEPLPLSDDGAYQGPASAAIDSNGRILAAYAVQMADEAAFAGRTDLVTLSHTFTQNLTVAEGDLAISEDHPAPGDQLTLAATVHNTGDWALDGVAVAFYDGDPGSGGTLIGEDSLEFPLPAGFTATLTVEYAVPETGGLRTLYAVADPHNAIPESDEGDNQVSQAAFGPDLEIADAGVEYWDGSLVGLRTLVTNIGTTTVPTNTLSFYLDAPGGAPLVQDVVPELEAGSTISLTTLYDFSALGAGYHALVAAANEGEFPEVWTENNVRSFTLSGLPDLMVSPLYLWSDAATGVITATVINNGVVTAENVQVDFYSADGLRAGTPLLSLTIPALPAGGGVTVTGEASEPLEGLLYVYVDPDRAIVETMRTNNLANIGEESAGQGIYLPLIMRNY